MRFTTATVTSVTNGQEAGAVASHGVRRMLTDQKAVGCVDHGRKLTKIPTGGLRRG